MLHDRRIPGSRANIDQIAVAPTGVWVIDTKRYNGKLEVAEPLFGKATLKVASRDQTKLVDGLVKRLELALAASATARSSGRNARRPVVRQRRRAPQPTTTGTPREVRSPASVRPREERPFCL